VDRKSLILENLKSQIDFGRYTACEGILFVGSEDSFLGSKSRSAIRVRRHKPESVELLPSYGMVCVITIYLGCMVSRYSVSQHFPALARDRYTAGKRRYKS
jgi:hypothetical protein